jgi:type IV pilus assembly protein PilF
MPQSRWKRLLTATILPLVVLGELGCAKGASQQQAEQLSSSEYEIAADLWARQRQPRPALEHALRAAELNPANSDAAHLVSLIYLEFCQNTKIGECRLSEAERFARQAVHNDPSSLAAQNTLAVVLVHERRFDEAISILKPLSQDILYGTPEIAWGNLGWAYLEKGELDLAISALSRAVAVQPLFCVGNYRLGVAYHRAARLASAREALDRALETQAAGCSDLQDAFLERAEVEIKLGAIEPARADLDRCSSLDHRNRTGQACAKLLSTL